MGYRSLLDKASGRRSTKGTPGVSVNANYYYMPIGISAKYKIFNKIKSRSEIEFDWLIDGARRNYWGYYAEKYSDVTNHQDTGYGIRISTDFIYQAGKVDFCFRPFFRYWSVNDSDISIINDASDEFMISANNTLEAGISITAQF